ncbi:MAG: hypothetical protein HFH87_14345 [Lachnospiraceae bacterium]|nr:hypothetical protein [Lachnospiraceae bacterium]
MNGLTPSEIMFYGGIAVMCLTAVAAVCCVILFKITGKKIRKILEQEYGKCHRQ